MLDINYFDLIWSLNSIIISIFVVI